MYQIVFATARRGHEQMLENIVGLTPEDLRAAWENYREHPADPGNDIRVNEAD